MLYYNKYFLETNLYTLIRCARFIGLPGAAAPVCPTSGGDKVDRVATYLGKFLLNNSS